MHLVPPGNMNVVGILLLQPNLVICILLIANRLCLQVLEELDIVRRDGNPMAASSRLVSLRGSGGGWLLNCRR